MRTRGANGFKAAVLIFLTLLSAGIAHSQAPPSARLALPGSHDFDFEFGSWHVHHRSFRTAPPLAKPCALAMSGRTSLTMARWEQAASTDAGRTWQTNWIMEFRRAV
jgi:hypothetical protein